MARAHDDSISLRLGRRESERLIVALLVSLLLHLTIWGGYHTGTKQGWWKNWRLPLWAQRVVKAHPPLVALPTAPVRSPDIMPTTFVDVSHADADVLTPTKYYSNKNSRAANEDTSILQAPKIEGRQKDIPKTEDVPKVMRQAQPVPAEIAHDLNQLPSAPAKERPAETSKPQDAPNQPLLQPTMPPLSLPTPEMQPVAQTETQQRPPPHGETEPMQYSKPASAVPDNKIQTPSQNQADRPRTIRQALAKNDQVAGPAVQQAGGVSRHAMWSSLDAKAVPFGEYDRAIIEAVQQRWYDLLDSHRFAQDRAGKVMLRFKLKPDGTIIEMETVENNVGELLGYLCQESIEEAAPFSRWPTDMQRMIGENYREVTFTFYYY